jgi:hypothetical protein
MNIEGRSMLSDLGFRAPFRSLVLTYEEFSELNLEILYTGHRCGASIEIGPARMKLSDGPNVAVKLSGVHNVLRENFEEALETVCRRAEEKGYLRESLRFALCQSVPHEVSMSGICARIESADGSGYLACEVLGAVRRGDFSPDYRVQYQISGGRPIGHTRKVQSTSNSIPSWATDQMHFIAQRVNKFGEGIIGVEFVFDRQHEFPIFHDLYWSIQPKESIQRKFHMSA